MYERMLDKNHEPSAEEIARYIGCGAQAGLKTFEGFLRTQYDIQQELKFPFGQGYGWGYKYSHRKAHLCYAFFEKGGFTVTLQIGDKQASALEAALPCMSAKTKNMWANRYPCGENGGWIHYRVLHDNDLKDICALILIRKPPKKTRSSFDYL